MMSNNYIKATTRKIIGWPRALALQKEELQFILAAMTPENT